MLSVLASALFLYKERISIGLLIFIELYLSGFRPPWSCWSQTSAKSHLFHPSGKKSIRWLLFKTSLQWPLSSLLNVAIVETFQPYIDIQMSWENMPKSIIFFLVSWSCYDPTRFSGSLQFPTLGERERSSRGEKDSIRTVPRKCWQLYRPEGKF